MSRRKSGPFYRIAAAAIVLWTLAFSLVPLAAGLAAAPAAVAYAVEIEGAGGVLGDLIEASSRLVSGQDNPPYSLAGLRQRADADLEVFRSVMRAQGFYGGEALYEIDTESSPLAVMVTVMPGPLFHIAECTIEIEGGSLPFVPENCGLLGLGRDLPARADLVLGAQAALRRRFLENGYPDATVERRAVVNHDGSIMNLEFTVTPGARMNMGEAIITGVERTNPEFIARLRPWDEGAIYDVRQIDTYRERINGLALFDSVTIAPTVSDATPRPFEVTVHEAPPRTIGGGVRYATTQGIGVNVFWIHRNLFGDAEALRADLGVASLAQTITATYSLPHRPNPEQRLDFTITGARETTDAYEKLGGELSGALTTPLAEKWRARIGAGVQLAEITDETGRNIAITGSLPADVFYDNSDSLLDPTTGERWSLRATAVAGRSSGWLTFLKLESEATAYRRLSEDGRSVIAGRIKLGTILGAERDAVPADRRFYAGGGGSVRGFGYQAIGPRDDDNDPLGGRSVAEAGIEFRQRVRDNWGGVAFVEAGSVGSGTFSFRSPSVGAGVGVRYFTAFGPIRADVATPLNPREGDARVQIYISIGQAF